MTRMHPTRVCVAAMTLSIVSAASASAQQPDPPQPAAAVQERAARKQGFAKSRAAAAIERGVHWLLLHQDQDGRWNSDGFMRHDPVPAKTGAGHEVYDVGLTSLALLAVLGQADAQHAQASRRAADWLCALFRDGRVDTENSEGIYGHALATLALLEAFEAFGDARYRVVVEQSLLRLDEHRTPGAGWRYQPKTGSDASVTAWCLGVYAAAARAGFAVPARSAGEALTWLDCKTDRATGRCGYTAWNERSARLPGDHSLRFPVDLGEALTAASLRARLMLGVSPQDGQLADSVALVVSKPPSSEPNAADAYYWYWGSSALAQFTHSPEARRWQQALEKLLLASQRDGGSELGSWDPIGAWGELYGRIGETAFAVLCLSSPYLQGDTRIAAVLPDRPPFRGICSHLRGGKLGVARRALDAIDPVTVPPEFAAQFDACRWLIDVEVAHCETALDKLAEAQPDVRKRFEWLEATSAAMATLPVGERLQAALQAMRDHPGTMLEITAANELDKLRKAYDEALASKSTSKRNAMRKKLTDFAERHSGTTTAAKVVEMIQRL